MVAPESLDSNQKLCGMCALPTPHLKRTDHFVTTRTHVLRRVVSGSDHSASKTLSVSYALNFLPVIASD